jgi:Ca2+-binding RTX toxin-like protein
MSRSGSVCFSCFSRIENRRKQLKSFSALRHIGTKHAIPILPDVRWRIPRCRRSDQRISTMTVKFGTDGSDYLDGTDSTDWLYGQDGNDYLEGYGGNDFLKGGAGADTVYGDGGDDVLYEVADGADDYLDGGSGTDIVDYSAVNNGIGIVINLATGSARSSAIGHDTLVSIENAVGSEAGDIIHGTDAGFLGIGGWGENNLSGGGGNDSIWGHSGNDTLWGGNGLDDLHGGDDEDTLHGGYDPDWLYGDAGDDKLFGDAGDDFLFGGPGNDHFDGGDGFDTVSYRYAADGVAITWDGQNEYLLADAVGSSLTEGVDSFANVEKVIGSPFGDFIQGDGLGAADNVIDGGDGDDDLYGDHPRNDISGFYGGNDILNGGNGHDWLSGDMGVDILTGGAGNDIFYFEKVDSGVGAGNRDIITDFQHGTDNLQIFIPNEDLSFIGQGTFTAADQVRFGYDGSDTIVQVNLDQDSLPEMEIQLTGYVTLTASDFYLLSH